MKTVFVSSLILLMVFGFSPPAKADNYVIGAEDVLLISVWGNQELNTNAPVRPDGMISLPLLGDVKAEGRTALELKKHLEQELKRYIKTPMVSVTLTSINSFKVYVFGEGVSRPGNELGAEGGRPQTGGQITLRRNTTLLQLLAQLGPLSNIDLPNAYVLRNGKKLSVNFEHLVSKADYSLDAKLEPNDIIFLPGGFTNRIRVTGAVRQPGLISYSEGMTALDAVLAAGGFTEFASENNVLVIRKKGKETETFTVKVKDVMNGDVTKNFRLNPGDVVTAKTGWF